MNRARKRDYNEHVQRTKQTEGSDMSETQSVLKRCKCASVVCPGGQTTHFPAFSELKLNLDSKNFAVSHIIF